MTLRRSIVSMLPPQEPAEQHTYIKICFEMHRELTCTGCTPGNNAGTVMFASSNAQCYCQSSRSYVNCGKIVDFQESKTGAMTYVSDRFSDG